MKAELLEYHRERLAHFKVWEADIKNSKAKIDLHSRAVKWLSGIPDAAAWCPKQQKWVVEQVVSGSTPNNEDWEIPGP